MLPDGRVLLGHIDSTKTAIYDPVTDTWTAGPLKQVSVVRGELGAAARRHGGHRSLQQLAARGQVRRRREHVGERRHAAREPHRDLVVRNRRRCAASSTGGPSSPARRITRRSTRAPSVATDPGTWTAGPDFPNDSSGQSVGCKDTPSCLLTNGHVLVAAGPVDGVATSWLTPTIFHLFDGMDRSRASRTRRTRPACPYIGRMLLLPTGQVLFAAQTNEIYAYTYFSCPDPAWRPQITSSPHASVRPGLSYSLSGQRFNGMSQAVGYGDDAAAATNYPLVRIRHLATGRIRYCRTHGHSTMGVATGSDDSLNQLHRPVWHSHRAVRAFRSRQRDLIALGSDPRALALPRNSRVGNLGAADRQPRRRRPLGTRPARADPSRSVGTKGRREKAGAAQGRYSRASRHCKSSETQSSPSAREALEVDVAPDEGSPEAEKMEEDEEKGAAKTTQRRRRTKKKKRRAADRGSKSAAGNCPVRNA